MTTSTTRKKTVVVLYNDVGEDPDERLEHIDPTQLPFTPVYPIRAPTTKDECDAMVAALRSEGYRARAVNLEDNLRKLERLLKRHPPDVVVNLVESFYDDTDLEGAVAGMFDLYGIRYTGSQPFALALCQDKVFTKKTLLAHAIPTPRYQVFLEDQNPVGPALNFPVIVKPSWEDASVGIDCASVVHDAVQLRARVECLLEDFDPPVLVEEFIDGPELHAAVWGNEPPEVLPMVELDFSDFPPSHPPFISYAAKWDPLDEAYHRVEMHCPPRLRAHIVRRVEEIAVRAYEASWCRDYARIDIRLRGKTPYVLEINPNPDLASDDSFMNATARAGYSFSRTLSHIVQMALERDVTGPQGAEPTAELPIETRPQTLSAEDGQQIDGSGEASRRTE